ENNIKNPIYSIEKVLYKFTGTNQWLELSTNKYEYSRNEIKLDLNSIWTNLAYIKIHYSFESFISQERSTIDPSFKSYSGTSDIQTTSASSKFFSQDALPLLWLNPGTVYYDPYTDWIKLPNGMTYQQLPLISGLGNEAIYPDKKIGWSEEWDSEYTSMPELENSLINYDGTYDNGQLSQYLNGQDDNYGEENFESDFEGNYIDNVLISNPFISSNYNFSSMYYSDIHDTGSEGIYNFYDPDGGEEDAQYIMVRNRLTSLESYNSSGISLIYNSGTLPQSLDKKWLTGLTWDTHWKTGINMGSVNSSYNTWSDTQDPSLGTFVQLDSVSVYEQWELPQVYCAYIWVDEFQFAGADFSGDIDYYVSCKIETFNGVSGTLYADYDAGNYIAIESGTTFELDRVPLNGLRNIYYHADRWGDEMGVDPFHVRIYYFKLEAIEETSAATQGAEIEENEQALLDWSKYLSTLKEDQGDFGFEFGFQLPTVDREGLDSIHIGFSASVSSGENANCPLSIQIWNFEQNRYESLPLFPLDSAPSYDDEKYLEFWCEESTQDKFRPDWITVGDTSVKAISFGDCFPNYIDAQGDLVIHSSIEEGASFLDNNPVNTNFDVYTGFQDNSMVSYSNGSTVNRFQLKNIMINPDSICTTNSSFPAPSTNTLFNDISNDFYEKYVNDLHQVKFRIITELDTDDIDSYLNIGAFNTYCLVKSDYLNYNDFESYQIDGNHLSENIDMTADGVKLYGYSGFSVKEPSKELKFRDNFQTTTWNLNVSDPIVFYEDVIGSAVVRSLYPNTNYNIDNFTTFKIDKSWSDFINGRNIISGSEISWDLYSTSYDDSDYHIIRSESTGSYHEALVKYLYIFSNAKTWDLNYIIFTNVYTDDIHIADEEGNILVSGSGTELSGSTRVEPAISGDSPYMFVGSMDNNLHDLKVDYLEALSVVEEWESFFSVAPIDYLYYGDQDSRNLEVTRDPFIYFTYIDIGVWAVGGFDPETITWNNRPSTYELASQKEISPGTPSVFTFNLGDIKDQYYNFKIDATSEGGFDFWNPRVKYSLDKKHQEGGILYMQTDETEALSLKSDVYGTNITITPNDQLTIECKGKTDNEIKLKLLSDGVVKEEFIVIPQGNTDFTSQIVTMQTNETIKFDQLEFCGTLDDKEYFLANSIGVYAGANIIDTNVGSYKFESHNINIGTALSEFNLAHSTDGNYYNISSESWFTSNQTQVDFKFNIPFSEVTDVNRIDVKLVGKGTSISLKDDAVFKFLNLKGSLEQISPAVSGDTYTFTFSKDQFYKLNNSDIGSYTIFFSINLNNSISFTIHIDSINAITYKPWSADHDLYRATFKFRRLGDAQNGTVIIAINDNMAIALNDSDLKDSSELNVISFNYDCQEQKWHAFVNDNSSDWLNLTDTDPEFRPRIESHYNDINEGILVKSIESHFYKKIKDQIAFDQYKTLIASYAFKRGYAASINTTAEDALLTPENLWAQVCSDVDIIYSFHDEMNKDNIFDYSLTPSYLSWNFDNLNNLLYNETVIADTSAVSKKYVNSIIPYKIENWQDTVNLDYDQTDLRIDDEDNYRITRKYVNNDDGAVYREATDESFYHSHGTGSEKDHFGNTNVNWDTYAWSASTTPSYRLCTAFHNGGWIGFTMTMCDYYKFDACTDRGTIIDIDLDIRIKAWAPLHAGTPDFYLEVYDYGESNWETLWSRGDLDPTEPSSYWTYQDTASPGGSDIFDSSDMYDYIGTDGKIYVRTKVVITDIWDGWSHRAQGMIETLTYRATTQIDPNTKKADFVFAGLNTSKDYLLMFQGKTDSNTATLKDGTTQITTFSTSLKRTSYLIANPTSTETITVDLGDENDVNGLDIDYLYLLENNALDIGVNNNKQITLNSSYSKLYNQFIDSGIYDDPYLGVNNIQFTIKNTLYTPLFERDNGSAYTDLFLNDLNFNFNLYKEDTYSGFPLGNEEIEGKNTTLYDSDELKDYSLYSTSRFRHSAIDEIQIPLITPIELDFGNLNPNDFVDLDLELALDWDLARQNAKSDYQWNSRFRLVIFNYSSGQWEDFKGILRAANSGVEKSVWNPDLHDSFVWYLQNPTANNFIPIYNDNDIILKNPILINSINNNTIQDGIMKLAFISYILPANFTGDGNNNYFSYERANDNVPIEISQNVNILECVLLGRSFQIAYPESSVSIELQLNEQFRANLSEVEKLGEIVAVKGKYLNEFSSSYEYSIASYWITENNELMFNSPMKYLFTSIILEYVPELELVWFNNKWYLPNSSYICGKNFTNPFLVSNLKDESKIWGTYIHPDVDVGFTLEFDEYGIYVANKSTFTGTPRGSIHFGKIDNNYLYKISLGDQLLYKYDILDSEADLIGGTLNLELNAGFKDVKYSELTQVSCENYDLIVQLYKFNSIQNKLISIGKATIPLDSNFLGYHKYNLEININEFNFGLEDYGRDLLVESITGDRNNDLIITINSSITNCFVDGHLFKGFFAQELLMANLRVDTLDSELIFNGETASNAYIPIHQTSIILAKQGTGIYQFDFS
ncbi:MAG: hypothetical protein ACFFDF_14005, partial [Candidatus Odinarchaeota archaeon]